MLMQTIKTRGRATCGLLTVLAVLSLAGAAGAEVSIRGVDADATVTGDLPLTARSTGRADMTVIQLIGPGGVELTNRAFGNGVSLMDDGSAWPAAKSPAGLYTVSAYAMSRGRIIDTARRSFTVEAQPAAPEEIESPAATPRVGTRIAPGDGAAVVPAIGFARGTAPTREAGSGVSIGINVDGDMPAEADVLILAWSNTEQRLMDGFSHVVRDAPWAVRASELNKLPVGEYELQLQPRLDKAVVAKVVMPLRVEPAAPPVLERPRTDVPERAPAAEAPAAETSNTPNQDLARGLVEASGPQVAKRDRTQDDGNGGDAGPAWSFAASAPEVFTRGSGTPISLDVPSRLPGDADFLVIAWSHTDKALVTAFDHKLNIKPFRLDQAKLDALPSGRIELQALYRDGSTVELKKHNLVVVGDGEDPKQYNEDADARRRDLASKGAASRAAASVSDMPRSTDGFTAFNRSADTVVVYVSSSTGDDANNGLSPATAVKSAEVGYELLRDGSPDWLLFKAGDTWDTGLPGWKKSGRSAAEKMLVGTYGTGDRPYFRVTDGHFLGSYGEVHHVAFVGLHAHAVARDPGDPAFQPNIESRDEAVRDMGGFVWLAAGGDVLVEDCKVEFFKFNLVFQRGGDDPYMEGVTVRRNIILNAYGHHDAALGGHSSGIFAKRVKGLLLEENVFDHNGWNASVDGADRTKFNHNLYIQYDCSQVTAIGNVISRGSAHGAQFRPGATVTNNLFVRNPSAFFVAQEESRVTRNVVLMSDDMTAEHTLGFGIDVLPTTLAVVENNIISTKRGTHSGAPAINVSYEDRSMGEVDKFDVCIRDNKICDWPVNEGARSSIMIGTDAANVFDQTGNQIDQASGGESNPPWVDPTRNVESYMQTLGKPGSLDEFIACAAARPRGVWVPAYGADAVNTYIRRGFDVELAD